MRKVAEQILADVGTAGHARAFYRHYCDWWLIDGELQLEDPSSCDDENFIGLASR